MGCDSASIESMTFKTISIHAPTWGATYKPDATATAFSISIHAPTWGATHYGIQRTTFRSISIHAPTWGATKFTGALSLILIISIHAPTWGATFSNGKDSGLMLFQSTHPRGVRRHLRGDLQRREPISIHAPTWGATSERNGRHQNTYFNPRTHVGCDGTNSSNSIPRKKFQSTHPRGVRRREQIRGRYVRLISIHAPTWGATRI